MKTAEEMIRQKANGEPVRRGNISLARLDKIANGIKARGEGATLILATCLAREMSKENLRRLTDRCLCEERCLQERTFAALKEALKE